MNCDKVRLVTRLILLHCNVTVTHSKFYKMIHASKEYIRLIYLENKS